MARKPSASPQWTPERASSRIALFRATISGATQLGLHVSMPIQAANNFCMRAGITSWRDLKDALNADIHWDLPGDIRLTTRAPLQLPRPSLPFSSF